MIERFIAASLALIACTAQAEQRPVLSLVIDDLGYSYDHGKAAIDLAGQHTYAILPGASFSTKLARYAHLRNQEIILHLPMQSISSSVKPEPDALNEAMDENKLTKTVQSLLARIPFIKGINNHMGSHLTELDFFMRPIMDSIRGYNAKLYFLDSRTTPRSVAYAQAVDAGLNSTTRDVFLDNDHKNIESIRLQYQIWLAIAREHGSAIAIGHPHPNTLKVIRENSAKAQQEFEFMPISKLIYERRKYRLTGEWRRSLTSLDEGLQQ
jgi:polysaccharide deacetylase 2 family uncharacterized protein YibQ